MVQNKYGKKFPPPLNKNSENIQALRLKMTSFGIKKVVLKLVSNQTAQYNEHLECLQIAILKLQNVFPTIYTEHFYFPWVSYLP